MLLEKLNPLKENQLYNRCLVFIAYKFMVIIDEGVHV